MISNTAVFLRIILFMSNLPPVIKDAQSYLVRLNLQSAIWRDLP